MDAIVKLIAYYRVVMVLKLEIVFFLVLCFFYNSHVLFILILCL